MFTSFNISQHWDRPQSRICLSYIINIMAANDLATEGAQDIISHDIDQFISEYSCSSTRWVNIEAGRKLPPFCRWNLQMHFLKGSCIFIQISLNAALCGSMVNKSALVQVMAWCQTGDKPLCESTMTQFNAWIMPHWSQSLKYVFCWICLKNINIYRHFLAFLDMNVGQVLKVLPCGRLVHSECNCYWWPSGVRSQGPLSIWRLSFPGMGIPMLKVRRSRDRLIFNIGIPILVRRHLYIETAPRTSTAMVLTYIWMG